MSRLKRYKILLAVDDINMELKQFLIDPAFKFIFCKQRKKTFLKKSNIASMVMVGYDSQCWRSRKEYYKL